MTTSPAHAREGPATPSHARMRSGSWSPTSEHPFFEANTPSKGAPEWLCRGQRLHRYVIGRRLGMGGFGVVYAAHDEALDRAVALKLLWPGRRRADRVAQLGQEAQVMARLRHPNIVTVFDVGLAGEHPFIVMELVDGGSMRQWLARARPSVAEIVEGFIAAARGLAAAHHAGIVHGDIKLSNLLVGGDGRVLVTDFGLFTALEPPSTLVRSSMRGAGTAPYMAPELLRGELPDARADQYALCVALHAALHGHYPFEEAAPGERVTTELAGRLASTMRRELTTAVRDAIVRGLALHPSDRFASLDALIEAMEQRPRRARLVGGLGVAAVVAVGLVVAGAPAPTGECRRAASLSLWPSDRQEAVTRALASTKAPFATSSSAAVNRQLSAHAERWSREYAAVCDAAPESPRDRIALDATLRCLRRTQLRVDALTRVISRADRSVAEHTPSAVEMLPLPGQCWSDTGSPWATGDEADAIEQRLAGAEVLRELGRYADAESLAGLAHRHAEASGAQGASARARVQRGLARLQLAHFDDGIADLEAAYFVARAEHDEPTALRAAIELLTANTIHRPDLEAAARWERAAEAVGDPAVLTGDAEARLRFAEAERMARVGNDQRRVRLHHEVLELRRRQGGERTLALANSLEGLGRARLDLGDVDDARALFREALEIRERWLGQGHPWLAVAHNNYGIALAMAGEQEQGLAHLEAGLQILEASLGTEHPRVGRALNNLANFTSERGSIQPALRYLERAVAILSAAQGSTHPETLRVRASWAEALRRSGAYQRAAYEASRVMADVESVAMPPSERLILQSTWGTALASDGQLERALEAFEAGMTLIEPDDDPSRWIHFQYKIAAVLHMLERSDDAYRVGRDAWSRLEPDIPPGELALLLSELEAERGDFREALLLARTARDDIRPWSEHEGVRRDEIDGWIERIEESLAAAAPTSPHVVGHSRRKRSRAAPGPPQSLG